MVYHVEILVKNVYTPNCTHIQWLLVCGPTLWGTLSYKYVCIASALRIVYELGI